MKRTGICLVAIAGTAVGVAAAQLAQGPMEIGGVDKEVPWLVPINVMQDTLKFGAAQGQFTIAVGDWVELSAWLPASPNEPERPYKIEADIKGEAVEQLASVRPATFEARGTKAAPAEVRLRPVPIEKISSENERRLLLRGKKAGKVSIRTTVIRGDTWKEIRDFVITVTEQREESLWPVEGGFQ
jgi:hypothetical protein